MKKKIALALLVAVCGSFGATALGEFGNEFEEQKAHFFGQISDSFNVDVAGKCAHYQELPDDADTRWMKATQVAIEDGRTPSYLEELHCLVAHSSRIHLDKYKKRHQKSDADQLAYNIKSFVMLHGFHSVLFDKIYDLTKRGLKELIDADGVTVKSLMNDYKYLNYSSTFAKKLDKHFSEKYPPNRAILANVRAMKLYQNEELLRAVLTEVQTLYPYEDDPIFIAQAIGRVAERRVLIEFIRKSGLIYTRINKTVAIRTEFLGKDELKLKDSIFYERFIRFIGKIKETHMNRFDPNVERFLIELFTLNTI